MKSTFFLLSNITTVFSDNLYLQYSDYCNKANLSVIVFFFLKNPNETAFTLIYIFFL